MDILTIVKTDDLRESSGEKVPQIGLYADQGLHPGPILIRLR